jgi:hypothetical protein
MDGWIAGVVIAVALVLVWWVFKPSNRSRTAANESAGSGMRLAERGFDAVARGLKVAVEDEALAERFDFPPFGRGMNRAATEVVTGMVDGEEIVAFRYSFALDGEAKRREYDVTVITADFPWIGRLRLTSLPRAAGASPDFGEAWRLDEEPPGVSIVGPELQSLLMADRLKASAIVATPQELVLIDAPRKAAPDIDADVAMLSAMRSALLSQ